MRLGGAVFDVKGEGPDAWCAAVKAEGYRAAFCPLGPEASDEVVRAYEDAARKADIVIAEVGAWSNPIASDQEERRTAIEKCKAGLDLADRIGARCCVNIAGGRGEQWNGPDPANLTEETFEMIVQSVREIIDAVQPTRTFYTLETMPWMFPDSPESYADLLVAIDRPAFAVHLDPVNLVCSPTRYYENAALMRECFRLLGPHIRSCHAKDTLIAGGLTLHLSEVRPGTGRLDYHTYVRELSKLASDVPLMIEHLPDAQEFRLAADHIRAVAREEGVEL